MCWKNVEIKCKQLYEDRMVINPIPVERKIMIQIIAEEFPNCSRVRIAAVVDHCFKFMSPPITRQAFISFLQAGLR